MATGDGILALQSMTGFARSEGSGEDASWVWELRSVNGKSLDLRLRLPAGFDALEGELRRIAAASMTRGNIQASLQLERRQDTSLPVLNEQVLDAFLEAARKAHQRSGLAMPTIGELMQLRGVIETRDTQASDEAQQALEAALLAGFSEAVGKLAQARMEEGRTVAAALHGHVRRIEDLRKAIEADPSRTPEAIAARLSQAMQRLKGESLDPERIHQEAVLLATRADLQEEIDRLRGHVEAAGNLLASGDAIGRKLDFLAQEFNRECNTICSKSNAASVTAAGLEMKAAIDQFREQVQNIQ